MKKIVRFTWTRKLTHNEPRFREEAQKIGDIDINFICYFDVYYHNWFRYLSTKEPVKDYDIIWIGWIRGRSLRDGIVYYYCHLYSKKLVDKLKYHMLSYDKFTQILFLEYYWFNTPESLFFVFTNEYKEKYINILEQTLNYPFIAKDVEKDQWKWIHLIKERKQLEELIDNNEEIGFLFQEYIENKWDYRTLVVWEKVIWTIKRYNENDFKNNFSTGALAQSENLPDNINKIAVDIANKFNLHIAWVDFFIENWKYYVIEINDLPQYQAFEEATGISYPYEVLNYFKNL